MKKPSKLKKGDLIAVVALSWGGHDHFPHIVDLGIRRLEDEFGFKVKRGNTLSLTDAELHASPEKRAEDLHNQFLDPAVKGIISIIGGSDGVRVLPHLNKDIFIKNPKFFMGYSDTSVFNIFLNQLGLVTFNGPSVMAGFAESHSLESDFIEHVDSFLFGEWETFSYVPFKRYVNNYLSWADPENLTKKNTGYIDNVEKFNFVQGDGIVQGTLFGGCIEVLEFLKGTTFWPDANFWNDKILFFETSEDVPSPKYIEYWLRNYGIQGVFDKINGLMFGRPKGFSDDEKIELKETILKVLKEFNKADLPLIINVDFGHTDPQIILPLGALAEIDFGTSSLKLLESPFK
ncbi:LD-carboxypeptidase [Candidatus Woesearchaeota archaeon]|nr:LD-carboxypeptidase [Candidatus Woesearchaeota archaeon]